MRKWGILVLVAICDDELLMREEIIRRCEKYKTSNINDFEIIGFASGEELLECTRPIDILFLDIQMKGLNGLKTAELIRVKDESMIIIFLTGYKGFMQMGYKVKAFRYLLKPIKEVELFDALTEAMNDITKNDRVVVGCDGEIIFLKLKEIIYVEYHRRCTFVRTRRYFYETTKTMSEWESILNTGDFFRVHKAYIVNMEYIKKIGKEILLDNGENVALSIRQSYKLKKASQDYRRRNAR